MSIASRETVYLAKIKGSKKVLQFSKNNHPYIERSYRTHFISPILVQIKKEKLETEEVVTEEVPTPTAKIE